jgi:outer membrane protein TolC
MHGWAEIREANRSHGAGIQGTASAVVQGERRLETGSARDQTLRGKWWEIFGDPQLNELEEEVTQSNQDLKVAEARFRQARAMIRFNRSAEFPTISTSPGIVNERDSPRISLTFQRRWRTMARVLSRCPLISRTKSTCGGESAVP